MGVAPDVEGGRLPPLLGDLLCPPTTHPPDRPGARRRPGRWGASSPPVPPELINTPRCNDMMRDEMPISRLGDDQPSKPTVPTANRQLPPRTHVRTGSPQHDCRRAGEGTVLQGGGAGSGREVVGAPKGGGGRQGMTREDARAGEAAWHLLWTPLPSLVPSLAATQRHAHLPASWSLVHAAAGLRGRASRPTGTRVRRPCRGR